jgi:hypothetical protein
MMVASRRTIGSRGYSWANVRISRRVCGSADWSVPAAWKEDTNRARPRW